MHSREVLHNKLPAGVMVGLAAVAGCASVSAPAPIAVEQAEWTAPNGSAGAQLLTEHYDLRVTITDALLQEHLAPFMETAFGEYARLIPPARERSDRLAVYLFGTRDEWADFTQSTFPARAYTYLHIHAGGYVDQPSATAVIHDLGRDRTLSLLAHEGFHQYLAGYLPRPVAAWLNEGLATQFEAFDLRGDRPVFTPRRNFVRRNSLRAALSPDGGFIPLADLLRMDAGEAVVKTGQSVRTYYAQVWSTILFLREGADEKYAEGFANLLADAGTKRLDLAVSAYRAATPDSGAISHGEAVFRHYITEDLAGFMAQYLAFARHLVR